MNREDKKIRQLKTMNVTLMILMIFCLVLIIVLMLRMRLTSGASDSNQTLPVDTQAVAEGTEEPEATETVELTQTTEASQVTEETAAPTQSNVTEDDTITMKIETPYLTLRYPAEWESYLRCDQKAEAGVYTAAFYCRAADTDTQLFDVSFGDAQQGDLIGYIMVGDEKVPVTVTYYDFVPDESWREDDVFVLYAMQEGVNDLILSVRENENYIAE